MKAKTTKSAKGKTITEKKTGEKYKSKMHMKMHEGKESMKEMIKEYGPKAAMAKMKSKSKKK
jgi:hypothetical protein